MTSGFAPEFLILLGIDVFLGASILTVLLDRHFPGALPYVLEGGALVGFAELMAGPTFLTSFSLQLQFYYSFIFALVSILALFATNLYLLFVRRRLFESAVLGICGTIPAVVGVLFFTSAFANGETLSLPAIPVVPIEGAYALLGLGVALVVASLAVFGRGPRPAAQRSREPAKEERRELPSPVGSANGRPIPPTPAAAHDAHGTSGSASPRGKPAEAASGDSPEGGAVKGPGGATEP